jgi:lipoprotein-releasing system permease protein
MTLYRQLQRQLNLLDYALAGLWRRKLKNLGIFLVLTAVIFLIGSLQLLTRGLSETAVEVLEAAPDITVQQLSAGRQTSIDTQAIPKIRELFGVARVTPRIWGYYFDEANGANYTVLGLEQSAPSELPELAAGRYPDADTPGEVVISDLVHSSLELGERRSFSLFRPDLSMMEFTVVGRFARTSDLVTADTILMTIPVARELFQLPETMVTDLLVQVANPREIDTIAGKIAGMVAGSRVLTRSQILKTYSVIYSWRSGFGSICLLAALSAFVILAYDRASGLSREDLRETAILKLLGWQMGEVMAIRFWEAAILSLSALVVGYALAWLHLIWWQGALFAPLLLGWSVLRPQFTIVPSFATADLLLIAAISVLPYMAATVVPAWRSAIVRPDTVI